MHVAKQHTTQCPICKSEFRNEIDAKVLAFTAASALAVEYPAFSEHSIANHSRITGLIKERMKNKRTILNVLVERGISILNTRDFRLDAGHIIKATELYAKLDGQLIERGELAITGSDEELLVKMKKLGSEGSLVANDYDSSKPEPDSESVSDTEDTGVDDSSGA